jgi:hypothetical protein
LSRSISSSFVFSATDFAFLSFSLRRASFYFSSSLLSYYFSSLGSLLKLEDSELESSAVNGFRAAWLAGSTGSATGAGSATTSITSFTASGASTLGSSVSGIRTYLTSICFGTSTISSIFGYCLIGLSITGLLCASTLLTSFGSTDLGLGMPPEYISINNSDSLSGTIREDMKFGASEGLL